MFLMSKQAGFSTVGLVVALGAAVIIGFGVFFMTRFANPSTAPSALNAKMERFGSEEVLTDRELNTTIPDIVGRGQNLECDWKLPGNATPLNKGKLWTTANKGRSSVTADISGMSMEAHALYQSNVVYSWTYVAGQKVGMKFSEATLREQSNALTAEERQQAEQIRSNMIMSCKTWIPDETKFTLPSDIEFQEI